MRAEPLFCGMRLAVVSLCAAALLLAGCDQPPVDWSDPVPIDQPSGPSKLVVNGSSARFVPDSVTSAGLPTTPGFCAKAFVTASGASRLYGAWWSVRPDSSASLVVSSSADSGRTWAPPAPVDTTDVSTNGCSRPLPSLTTVGDDVYVAYSMDAPEGRGVFFAHFMSNMLHSPVPVVYGDRLVATAIAADSNRVAVAYEQPSGKREEVDVAISNSQGHLFETHTRASRDVDNARAPMVAFNGPALAVSWLTHRELDTVMTRVVRVGRIRP